MEKVYPSTGALAFRRAPLGQFGVGAVVLSAFKAGSLVWAVKVQPDPGAAPFPLPEHCGTRRRLSSFKGPLHANVGCRAIPPGGVLVEEVA